jgi:hypothetical protein
MDCGFVEGTHEFSDWLYGVTETQESPVLFRVRNDTADNAMVLY